MYPLCGLARSLVLEPTRYLRAYSHRLRSTRESRRNQSKIQANVQELEAISRASGCDTSYMGINRVWRRSRLLCEAT
jgi:hypothetical protein